MNLLYNYGVTLRKSDCAKVTSAEANLSKQITELTTNKYKTREQRHDSESHRHNNQLLPVATFFKSDTRPVNVTDIIRHLAYRFFLVLTIVLNFFSGQVNKLLAL